MLRLIVSNLTLLLSLCFLACSHRGITPMGDYASHYHTLLRQELRSQGFFGFDSIPYLTSVVHRSDKLRRAYVEEYAQVYRLNPAEKNLLLERELEESKKFIDVVVVHFATDDKLAHLDTNEKVWQIRLDTGSQRLRPHMVSRLPGEAPVNAYFYPQITHWSRNYLVRFSREDQASLQPMTLHLDSIEGNISFKLSN